MGSFFSAIKSKHSDISRAESLLQSSSGDKNGRPASAQWNSALAQEQWKNK